ncbi:hypothetical protein ACFWCB_02320 [Streptomyces sp. NPDC060048]|uniref:hypothetical protein n=1 Tax=unclassified Streptomyces TaxID=2593676 RepID=UPI003692E124
MKPHTAQIQCLGSFAVPTLCPDGRAVTAPVRTEFLGHALTLVPPAVRFLELDGARSSDRDTAEPAGLVRAWAADRSAY